VAIFPPLSLMQMAVIRHGRQIFHAHGRMEQYVAERLRTSANVALAEREELKSNIICSGWWGTDEKRAANRGGTLAQSINATRGNSAPPNWSAVHFTPVRITQPLLRQFANVRRSCLGCGRTRVISIQSTWPECRPANIRCSSSWSTRTIRTSR
jgi:hypothetical protein